MNDEILKRIDALAAKLGVAGAELWRILVKQAKVDAISDVAWAIVSIAIIFGVIKLEYWAVRRNEKEEDDWIIGITIISVIVGVTFLIVGIASLMDLPTALFNPEYRALELLKHAIK